MCKHSAFVFVLVAVGICPIADTLAQPVGSVFTYQGQLKLSGSPLNGAADFEFTLWDAGTGGEAVGSMVPVNNVTVVDGLFTVELDFGVEVFNGESRWLEIAVRSPAGGGEFTTLEPRQALTATPYSLQTRGLYVDELGNVGIGTTSPTQPLSVAGIIEATSGGFKFPDSSVQNTAAVNGPWDRDGSDISYNAGNVGIGTSGPDAPLDVRSSSGTAIQAFTTSGTGVFGSSDDFVGVQGYSTGEPGVGVLGLSVAGSGESAGY